MTRSLHPTPNVGMRRSGPVISTLISRAWTLPWNWCCAWAPNVLLLTIAHSSILCSSVFPEIAAFRRVRWIRQSAAVWLLLRAEPRKDYRALPASAQRKRDREPARRQHSRLTALVQYRTGHRPTHQRDHAMSESQPWPGIAVVGAGAVGGYFGSLLARAGAPVRMIGRPAFVEAVKKHGLFLDTLQFQERVQVEVSTDHGAVRGAEVVLFCVKTTDNAATARAIAPLLSKDALVLSMQNGVDNVEQIRAAAGIDALPSVVYVAASVPEPGRVKHVGRGDLVVGPKNAKTERVAALFRAPMFRAAFRKTSKLSFGPSW